MPTTRALAEPSLVGREEELEQLDSLLNCAVEEKGKTVFVSGEAGSGKTRLVTEFLNRAKRQGVITLTGWCLSNAAVPYFPFFEAFKVYFTGENETIKPEELEVTAWLRGPGQAERAGKVQAISPQLWKDQTFAAVTKTLLSISAKKPVILFIDDLHWADSASLALIHYIARAIGSERVLLLATFRSEQLTPDAEGRPHPLVETLRLMRREDLYREIKVANLSQTNISELARSMLGGDIQGDFAAKLGEESQGNALFVVESVRMLHERNCLTVEQEKWRLASGELVLPEKIKDIILQRLGVLLHNQRRILEAASVIGEKFDTELLASTLGQDHLEVADALGMIARATSLVCPEGEQYRFDHARSRDTVYDEVSPALKRAYHGKIAERLESASKEGKLPLSELAYHFVQAGNKEKAVKYTIAAGQDALAKWSNAQAIEHFTYALQNLSEVKSEERRTALDGLGDAYASNNMYREAMKTFDKLAALETGRLRLRAIRKAMDAAYFIWGAFDLLLDYAKKAEELGVDDRLEMARILVNRGRAFGWAPTGSMEKDLVDTDAALQVFEEEYSLSDVATALWRSGTLCVVLKGLQKKGLGELLRSVSIFNELGDLRKEVEAIYWTGAGFANCFLFPEARNEYANVLGIGEKLGMFAELALACTRLAVLDEWDGKLAEAVSNNLKAIEHSQKTDAMSGMGQPYGDLIRIYSKLGDLKHVDEWHEKSRAMVTEEARSHYIVAPLVALTAGVRLAAKGQWSESNQTFEKLIDSLKTGSYCPPSLEFNAIFNYAWVLEKQGRFEEAKVQQDRIQELRREAEARFEHADLQAHLMVRRQVAVGEEFEMRLDLVNVGRKPALLVKAENVLLDGLKVETLPSWCSTHNGIVEMKDRVIGAFQVESVKLTLKGAKAGTFTLALQTVYVDDLGETKTCKMNTVSIAVLPATPKVCPGRVSSGTVGLDELLLGGIFEKYSVILTASSSDERELLIRRFLETAVQTGKPTLYLTTDVGNTKALTETFPANFSLFLCSPQAELITEKLPNLCRLKGVDNLTEIDIALAKYFRTLDPSKGGPRIACVQIVSDVLLQHHAVVTRKWLSSLLANLKSRGFTALAVIDPSMHPPEEVNAILGLFDGEIEITGKETAKGLRHFLRIRKLYNQEYLEKELILDKGTKH